MSDPNYNSDNDSENSDDQENMSPTNIVSEMPSTLSVPMMSTGSRVGGGRRRRATRKTMYGGQTMMPNAPPMPGATPTKMMGGRRKGTRKNMYGGSRSAVGSKAQVWHGTANHTSGGLKKKDLMKHKGRIISRKKHALGKKALKNLVKAGYKAKKGTFKLFRK